MVKYRIVLVITLKNIKSFIVWDLNVLVYSSGSGSLVNHVDLGRSVTNRIA